MNDPNIGGGDEQILEEIPDSSSGSKRWWVVVAVLAVAVVAGGSFFGVDQFLKTQVTQPSYDYVLARGELTLIENLPDTVGIKQLQLCSPSEAGSCIVLSERVLGPAAQMRVPYDVPLGEAVLNVYEFVANQSGGGYGDDGSDGSGSGYDGEGSGGGDSGYGGGDGGYGSGYDGGSDTGTGGDSGYGGNVLGDTTEGEHLELVRGFSVLVIDKQSSSPSVMTSASPSVVESTPSPVAERRETIIVTGPDVGGGPNVRLFNAAGEIQSDFLAYGAGFTGGVRVAMGDVDNDGVDEIITGPGPGGGPDVRIFEQSGELVKSFFAYDGVFTGGVYVAVGEYDGDGYDDIITGPGAGGGPDVRIFSGRTGELIGQFLAYDPTFTGGVRVAAGPIRTRTLHSNRPNEVVLDDIVTAPGPGGGPQVKVFRTEVNNSAPYFDFFAYDSGFTGGVFPAVTDINDDNMSDIVTGPDVGGGPDVRRWDGNGRGPLGDGFFAYNLPFGGGVRVTGVPRGTDDGFAFVTAAGPTGGPHVKIFNKDAVEQGGFFAYDPGFTGGVFVAAGSRVAP